MGLTNETKRQYRAIGHTLNPVVIVSDKGITDGVTEETRRALNDHELIKVKFAVLDRQARKVLMDQLCQATGAQNIQTIGKTALMFKAAKEPNPRRSNLLRAKP